MTTTLSKTRIMTRVALMAAVLCIISQFSIPIGEVPITLQTLFIVLTGVLLGPKLGALTALIYLLLGAVGLPVFAGAAGGFSKIVGPTGGFLIGFVPMAFLCGLRYEHGFVQQSLCALAGDLLLDVLGTAQLMAVTGMSLMPALAAAVAPFVLKDVICVFGGVALGRFIRARINQ